MKQRRLLVLALGASLSGHAALLRAQTPRGSMRRVGVLAPSTRAKEEITLKPFFDQMYALGWIEGQNIEYQRAYADDRPERLSGLAAELVARRMEVIYATVTPAVVAAKQATHTIPIVFGVVSNPVGIGLVASLARPGGNVTGMSSSLGGGIGPKRIELLREMLPGIKRIGLLADASDPTAALERQLIAPLAASLGLTFSVADAANPAEFDAAVASLIADRVEVILPVGTAPLVFNMRARLIELASQRGLVVFGANGQFPDGGALFSYGAVLADYLRRSAFLVDKVLKGAKPADLPVEQPTLFELVVNLKAAKALGITIPRSILLRADRVVE